VRGRARGQCGRRLAPRGERFDLILANPPYLPGTDGLPRVGAARAWEGGADGRALIDRLCDAAPAQLAPAGRLVLVHSSLCGERATLAQLAAAGLEPAVLARRRGPLGPLLRARAERLRARGLLRDGQDEEELLVLAGAQPA
jgi:release factor glutamine methyltransferase